MVYAAGSIRLLLLITGLSLFGLSVPGDTLEAGAWLKTNFHSPGSRFYGIWARCATD
jgi:hypothetical protein